MPPPFLQEKGVGNKELIVRKTVAYELAAKTSPQANAKYVKKTSTKSLRSKSPASHSPSSFKQRKQNVDKGTALHAPIDVKFYGRRQNYTDVGRQGHPLKKVCFLSSQWPKLWPFGQPQIYFCFFFSKKKVFFFKKIIETFGG